MSTWRNWAGTESATGVEVLRPSSTDEVAAMVKAATEQGKRVKAVTRGIDVMPTVLDVLGLPLPDHLQGTSLRGLWEGRPEPPRLAVSESLSTPNEKKVMIRSSVSPTSPSPLSAARSAISPSRRMPGQRYPVARRG